MLNLPERFENLSLRHISRLMGMASDKVGKFTLDARVGSRSQTAVCRVWTSPLYYYLMTISRSGPVASWVRSALMGTINRKGRSHELEAGSIKQWSERGRSCHCLPPYDSKSSRHSPKHSHVAFRRSEWSIFRFTLSQDLPFLHILIRVSPLTSSVWPTLIVFTDISQSREDTSQLCVILLYRLLISTATHPVCPL